MYDIRYEITGYYELLNLHKALLEAKFHQNPDNKLVSGSPFIAKICNDIVDLLQEYDYAHKGKDIWKEWRKISNQDYYKKRIIEKIVDYEGWSELERNTKKDILLNYLSPFQCDENEIDDLIIEVDKELST